MAPLRQSAATARSSAVHTSCQPARVRTIDAMRAGLTHLLEGFEHRVDRWEAAEQLTAEHAVVHPAGGVGVEQVVGLGDAGRLLAHEAPRGLLAGEGVADHERLVRGQGAGVVGRSQLGHQAGTEVEPHRLGPRELARPAGGLGQHVVEPEQGEELLDGGVGRRGAEAQHPPAAVGDAPDHLDALVSHDEGPLAAAEAADRQPGALDDHAHPHRCGRRRQIGPGTPAIVDERPGSAPGDDAEGAPLGRRREPDHRLDGVGHIEGPGGEGDALGVGADDAEGDRTVAGLVAVEVVLEARQHRGEQIVVERAGHATGGGAGLHGRCSWNGPLGGGTRASGDRWGDRKPDHHHGAGV